MFRITQSISIGPYASLERADLLLRSGITHVLNVSDAPSEIVAGHGFIDVDWIPMPDNRKLMPHTALRAIDALHRFVTSPDSHVYVHCVAGLVRSPTILWLYLVGSGSPLKDAKEMIELRSPGAVAGHPQMVSDEHVLLVRKHGQQHFLPHSRLAAIAPLLSPAGS
jgi:hypothetical protein